MILNGYYFGTFQAFSKHPDRKVKDPMRRVGLVALLAVAMLAPSGSTATATPGGLDRASGHHCWTRCSSYGKRTGKYHCHRYTRACKRSLTRHRRHGH